MGNMKYYIRIRVKFRHTSSPAPITAFKATGDDHYSSIIRLIDSNLGTLLERSSSIFDSDIYQDTKISKWDI